MQLSLRWMLACLVWTGCASVSRGQITSYDVQPPKAVSSVGTFDNPSIAVIDERKKNDAPLVVFLPGTGGMPYLTADFLRAIAKLGFRVLGLMYDDDPSVAQVCSSDPDPGCSGAFRRMRVYGTGVAKVSNSKSESINGRLYAALKLLNYQHPNAGWNRYLLARGPRWSQIILSGISQGAGMAAYIAKGHSVSRVVLFSSPWDFTGSDRHPAPWLRLPSRTPPKRWFAAYHAREKTHDQIRRAYTALRVPQCHIKVFNLNLPSGFLDIYQNPYHIITIRDPRYEPFWAALFLSPEK